MENTSDKLKKVLDSVPVRDKKKLELQQKYYKRLSYDGIAKKQTYNLKPMSAV